MTRLFLIALTALILGSPSLKLAGDIHKDQERLVSEPWGEPQLKDVRFDLFKPFTKLDLSRFHYSRRQTGGYVIDKWAEANKGGLTIYQAAINLPVDTFEDGNPVYINGKSTGKTEKLHIKTTFKFRIYIIRQANGGELIYGTEEQEGLYQMVINNKDVPIMYEDIPLGIRYPDLKSLLKMVRRF
ncbi:hypothetical protein C8P68_105199 [Mucilaginibacter yixingensis]|uniref:Uncharacterized protein n=1 Tax=Mucilaginibacter yixingensis TaxID=1295612 RepID=A0A2T5J8D2_9SPHI|nr:hypothetical protein [Mucilaginibacter yixingensis]PTQ95692.1 hypothetical protein C8P68_105199 [Mucilaginibacter yixingensis]